MAPSNIMITGIPDEIMDRSSQGLIQSDDEQEHYKSYDDVELLTVPPYMLEQRAGSVKGMWYMFWFEDGKSIQKSTDLTEYSLAHERAKELWNENRKNRNVEGRKVLAFIERHLSSRIPLC